MIYFDRLSRRDSVNQLMKVNVVFVKFVSKGKLILIILERVSCADDAIILFLLIALTFFTPFNSFL